MKQGRASRDVVAGTKVEPRSSAVNPAYPAQLGTSLGNHITDGRTVPGAAKPMISGPGLRAPMVSHTIHKGGSQGRR